MESTTIKKEEKKFTDDQLEQIEDSHLKLEVWEAGIELGISFDDIEEAYNGEFRSDKEFAEDMADQCGNLRDDVNWPYTCIDWDWAAKELMYDYCEENGHYFRNM